MFGRTRKQIRIQVQKTAQPLVVEADQRQIEQVLLNLYVNAWQAMPDGGDLLLKTSQVSLDETVCKPHQAEAGRYVTISMTDTGIGMDEATRRRIFDPFFTTKTMGRGAGLGLASAYGIIKNHGGMIKVYSVPDHGTTFNIYLPASEKEVCQEDAPPGRLHSRSATILLIDDEELIINVGKAMLEKLGYRVVVANGGQKGIDVVAAMGNEIDLVILDMIMPGVDGYTAFDRIRKMQPKMPVILSSGYAINDQTMRMMQKGGRGFIQKPFTMSFLSQKVRQVLETTSSSLSDATMASSEEG